MTSSAYKFERVIRRVELWADYIIAEREGGKSSTPSYMRLSKGAPQSVVLLPCNFDAFNEINDTIIQLEPILLEVLRLEWLEFGTQEQKAKLTKPRITSRTFRSRLQMAYQSLEQLGL